jgi:hypothetical protein
LRFVLGVGICYNRRMETRFRFKQSQLTLVVLILGTLIHASTHADEREEFFESRVRPLLVDRCFECHQRRAEGGLRLDSKAAMLKGGESGAAIVPGKPAKSLLMRVITGKHDEIKMPPDGDLPASDIELLRLWIADGSVWPQAGTAQRSANAHGITDKEREFWSFQPVNVIETDKFRPAEDEADRNPIDILVQHQYRQRGLRPAPAATPRTLLRRVTFDLTGLPPTESEVSQFLSAFERDPQQAYEQHVDRLLGSRAYAERWAQHWLDLVRYADTAGDAADFPIPEAYKYRNYVIDAFERDTPYDQFIREQIAGDLLPFESDEQRWRQTTGTGYIAISRRIGVSPQGLRHITIEDTLNNLGKTFLGLTIGCARCHDHKFDPIPTADYYALYGIFDSTVYPHVGAEHQPWRSNFVYRIGKEASDDRLREHRAELEVWNKKEREALERYRDFQRKPINIPGYDRDKAWQDVLEVREQHRQVAVRFPDLEIAYAAGEGEPHDVAVHIQGNPRKTEETVPRGFLQILGGAKLNSPDAGSGRRDLADWIASPDNPLTARVMVNRIWQHHFGAGIVATPSDFGVRGSAPSHPELLDFLATSFVENGWSIKALHRKILHSQTYQLSSADVAESAQVDPENQFFWRANRRHLDAEQLRDTILLLAGTLDRRIGERHPFPHRLTYFYRQHEPYVADFPTNQRTVYMFRQRIRKNEFLDLFDSPDGNLHVGNRRATLTTLQALFFINSEFAHEKSRLIAARFTKGTDRERVRAAYQEIFGRPVADEELKGALAFVTELRRSWGKTTDVALVGPARGSKKLTAGDLPVWASFVRSMISSNEFLFID